MALYGKLKQGARHWLFRRLPACQEIVATISQSMERPLTPGERFKLNLHLWICSLCQWYLEHVQLIRDTARAAGSESHNMIDGPRLSAEAKERIRRNLTAA
jgi:hypothetical protein